MGIAQPERIEGIARPEGQILLVLPWYSNGEVVEFLRRLKTLGGRTRFIGKINQLVRLEYPGRVGAPLTTM